MKISIHRNKLRFVLYIKLTCRPTWFKICILICCVCVIVRFQYKRNNGEFASIVYHKKIKNRCMREMHLHCARMFIITARRSYASAALGVVILSVCSTSVCHTPVLCQNDCTQHGARIAKCVQFCRNQKKYSRGTTPSPEILAQTDPPLQKAVSFDTFCLVARQR